MFNRGKMNQLLRQQQELERKLDHIFKYLILMKKAQDENKAKTELT